MKKSESLLEKVRNKKNFTIFSKETSRDFKRNLFYKAQKLFREHHNNFYKDNFSQEEYEDWNDYIKEDWTFRPNLSMVSKNRQFDTYCFYCLEASKKNPDKKRYARSHLQHDLSHFFRYLPLSEIRRMTYVVTWLMKEALKNYGCLVIPGFGTFAVFDKPLKETHQAFCGKKWIAPRYRLRRSIEFYPSTHLYNLIVPRNTKFMGFEGRYNRSQYILSMFDSYVEEKVHRLRGRIFFQDVFDKQWSWLGYSDLYARESMNMMMFDDAIDWDDLNR